RLRPVVAVAEVLTGEHAEAPSRHVVGTELRQADDPPAGLQDTSRKLRIVVDRPAFVPPAERLEHRSPPNASVHARIELYLVAVSIASRRSLARGGTRASPLCPDPSRARARDPARRGVRDGGGARPG